MNPKKRKKKKKLEEKKNSAIPKSTTAVRQTESKRGERAVREYMRGTEEQRNVGGSKRRGKKRGEGSRESAQLCV